MQQRCELWIAMAHATNMNSVQERGTQSKQPTILPGQYFEYMSYCPIKTPIGFMKGEFRMVDDKDKEFDVEIKCFRLFVPEILN